MLRVFESFSGVGAQCMALRDLKKDYEIVATADIDISAILAYYYVHGNNAKSTDKVENSEKIEYLLKKGISNEKKLISLKQNELDNLYNAVKICNNIGDIRNVTPNDIPDHDLFTYSFPCQDISSIGTNKGFDIGSGTRSSLLWECKKIIESKKPKYLLLENVKNLSTGKNKNNFNEWLKYLESQGYENFWKIFDAKDYGIPQRRPRVIVVSKLGKSKINLIKDNPIDMKTIDNIMDISQRGWTKFIPKAQIKGTIEDGKTAFLDDRDWKLNGVMISDLCSTQRAGRTGLKLIKRENNNFFERKLNALECCRLMGYSDEDYKKMKNGNLTDGTIMRICGNSIVVDVLKNVFLNIYEEEEL